MPAPARLCVGVDASRATVAQRTGTEHYARRLIDGLLRHNARPGGPGHHFRLYFRAAPPPGLFPGAERRVIPFPRLWTHLRLSAELLLARPRPDVLFVPAHVLPVLHPLPAVVTVHDLGYHHFPDAHPPRQRQYLEWSTRFSARGASQLLADSRATAADLARLYAVPPEKITVVYPGRDEALGPADPAPVRARYGLRADYVLHVGTLQPRKNLLRLMDAVSALREQGQAVHLVLAGRAGWLAAPILARARELAGVVQVLDYVPDADLPGLYAGARAFAFPSLYEGFGFPILEALACETPVVCANTSSLPELAGDAALLVDPTDTAALTEALRRVLTDEALRAVLIARGREQVQRFSWARAADETLRVLERAARG
jgi:glycosyltransferase involved in cell wall biosynthesis